MEKKFKANNIFSSYTTVAEQLCAQRRHKSLSFKKISRKININPKYLQALEEEDYDRLPEGVYQTKILKKYASFLGLDPEKLREQFTKEKQAKTHSSKNNLFSVKKIKKCNFLVTPKIIRNGLTVLIIGICFACLGIYLNGVFSPPKLQIHHPNQNNLTVKKKQITISGETTPETKVYINNSPILNNEKGTFNKEIRLKQGINTITIKAEKKYGQEKVIKKQILVREG